MVTEINDYQIQTVFSVTSKFISIHFSVDEHLFYIVRWNGSCYGSFHGADGGGKVLKVPFSLILLIIISTTSHLWTTLPGRCFHFVAPEAEAWRH